MSTQKEKDLAEKIKALETATHGWRVRYDELGAENRQLQKRFDRLSREHKELIEGFLWAYGEVEITDDRHDEKVLKRHFRLENRYR